MAEAIQEIDSIGENAVRRERLRHELFRQVASALSASKIPFGVLNGYFGSSPPLGRDVDLLVMPVDVPRIVDICAKVAERSEWKYVTGRWLRSWWRRGLYQVVLHRLDLHGVTSLAIDLICSDGVAAGAIGVYSVELLRSDIRMVDDVPTCPTGHLMKRLIQALAGHEAGLQAVANLTPLSAAERTHLTKLFGTHVAQALESSAGSGELVSTWRRLRTQAITAYSTRHPVLALSNAFRSVVRKAFWRIGSRAYVADTQLDQQGLTDCDVQKVQQLLRHSFIRLRHPDDTSSASADVDARQVTRPRQRSPRWAAAMVNRLLALRATRSEIVVTVPWHPATPSCSGASGSAEIRPEPGRDTALAGEIRAVCADDLPLRLVTSILLSVSHRERT